MSAIRSARRAGTLLAAVAALLGLAAPPALAYPEAFTYATVVPPSLGGYQLPLENPPCAITVQQPTQDGEVVNQNALVTCARPIDEVGMRIELHHSPSAIGDVPSDEIHVSGFFTAPQAVSLFMAVSTSGYGSWRGFAHVYLTYFYPVEPQQAAALGCAQHSMYVVHCRIATPVTTPEI